MFSIGVDALWLDATEPEFFPTDNTSLFLGSGNLYKNPYSLFVTDVMSCVFEIELLLCEFADFIASITRIWLCSLIRCATYFSYGHLQAIHSGQAVDYPARRIFSLTRSSFLGQQRTGGVLWSGDIAGTWVSFRRQV